MFQPTFKPSLIEVIGDEIVLQFNRGDIVMTSKLEVYTLQSSNVTLRVRICNQKVLNKDNFIFESESGKRISYHAMQVKSLFGITELLNELITNSVDTDEYIVILPKTEELISEIMESHKNDLINKYLEEMDFTSLKELLAV